MAARTPAKTLQTPRNPGAATFGEEVSLAADYDPSTSTNGGGMGSTRAVWVGGAGNLKVDMVEGGQTGITFHGIAAGTLLPIAVSKIYSTANGTSATLVIALW